MAKRYYDNMSVHKRNEKMDGDMLESDYSAPACMPQGLKIKMYPKQHYGYEAELIDTYRGIDYQIAEDTKMQKRGKWPKKQ